LLGDIDGDDELALGGRRKNSRRRRPATRGAGLPAPFASRLLFGAPGLFLGARGLRFGAVATVGGLAPIAAATTASATALSGLGLVARFRGLGRYRLF
jgi:hypothetical protein